MKDRRYATIQKLISGNLLGSFREIFDTLPKSVVAKDLGIDLVRFTGMMNDVERFSIRNLFRLAALLEVDPKKILDLIYTQYIADQKGKKKTK
jgi:hypothetical protein